MKLTQFQAKLIMKARVKANTSEIWLRFDGEYCYPYINQSLNLLTAAGYLIKEHSSGRKRETYYTATKEAVKEAENVLREEDGGVVEKAGPDTGQVPALQEHHDGADAGDEEVRVLQPQLQGQDEDRNR